MLQMVFAPSIITMYETTIIIFLIKKPGKQYLEMLHINYSGLSTTLLLSVYSSIPYPVLSAEGVLESSASKLAGFSGREGTAGYVMLVGKTRQI